MYCYMARQPILDVNKQLFGYELLFRDGVANSFPAVNDDEATSKLITEHHLLLGVEKITGGHLAFINFSADTLIHHFPTSISPRSMVIEILETVPISAELLTACKELHGMGYQLALDDHDFDPKWDVFLPYIRFIKVDVQQFNLLQISKYVSRIQHHPVTLLAEKVETAQQFEQLRQMGFQLFQGYFFAKPQMLQHKKIPSNKLNLLELIAESSRVELDFARLSAIVERDLALSYKLLRFINSARFSRDQPIASLKHAMIYMGATELKKFIALLALSNLSADDNHELLKISVVRARFCDQLAALNQEQNNPPAAFLTGLFSLVDALLEQPLNTILDDLPILPSIKSALLAHDGRLGQYLALAKACELADWTLQQQLAERAMLTILDISPLYLESVCWAEQMMQKQAAA